MTMPQPCVLPAQWVGGILMEESDCSVSFSDDCKNALGNVGGDPVYLHDLIFFLSEVVDLFCVKCWAQTYIYLKSSFRNVL